MRTGLVEPTHAVSRLFGKPLELHRCATDGGLVVKTQASLGQHAGHRVNSPVTLSLFELILIWTRLIHD